MAALDAAQLTGRDLLDGGGRALPENFGILPSNRLFTAVRGVSVRWWLWFDFDSPQQALVYTICSVQVLVLLVGAVVLHAAGNSPY